jgi:hypothetical protein
MLYSLDRQEQMEERGFCIDVTNLVRTGRQLGNLWLMHNIRNKYMTVMKSRNHVSEYFA